MEYILHWSIFYIYHPFRLCGEEMKRLRFSVYIPLFMYSLNLILPVLKPISSFSSPYMVIAVLDFENTGGEAKYQTLSSGISESLSTFLIKYSQGKLIVAERTQVEKAVSELGFQKSGFTDEKNALQVGKLTNATHVLLGSYSVIDNVLRINARLISVETGEGVLAESVTGKGGKESFNQINVLSAKIIESLTGKKVKIQNFKDVNDPVSELFKTAKKKNNITWIVIAVVAVTAIVISLGKSEQTATQTVNVQN